MSIEPARVPGYLTLICQGPTAATRQAAFPLDEALEEGSKPLSLDSLRLERVSELWCSPALAAQQTAATLGLRATIDPSLRDCDYGRWKGRRLTDLFSTEPVEIERWMTDPTAVPHGGESLAAVGERTRHWLAKRLGASGHCVAVTHNTVIRLALLSVLDAPISSFWHVDVEPFSSFALSSNGRRWALRIRKT